MAVLCRACSCGKPGRFFSCPGARPRHLVPRRPIGWLQEPEKYDPAPSPRDCRSEDLISVEGKRVELRDWSSQHQMRRENDCSFDEILQFANVPGPTISDHRVHGLLRDFVNDLVHPTREELCEMPNKLRNVLGPLPQ